MAPSTVREPKLEKFSSFTYTKRRNGKTLIAPLIKNTFGTWLMSFPKQTVTGAQGVRVDSHQD